METRLADFIRNTPDGDAAEAILRSCVHCGFCLATCPTYQLLGDELDGPRGRIYLIKQTLEGAIPTAQTQLHLDRCLTCRNCETTCPSGVQYGRLVEIGRQAVARRTSTQRPIAQRFVRATLRAGLTRPALFGAALRTGQLMRPLLPAALRSKIPSWQAAPLVTKKRPARLHARRMLLLEGCVQPALSPNINAATARVLDAVGVQTLVARRAGCCGAIRQHLDAPDDALDDVRRNIDAWWPYIELEQGTYIEAIVITASGCGVMVKDYGHLLRHDPLYADKACRVAALAKDLSEILPAFENELLPQLEAMPARHLAWHPPCTLQHGQQIRGTVERLLRAAGAKVELCADSHSCCGSAGTYSILQPELALRLRDDKLRKLEALQPDMIVSANIGCLTHLQSGTQVPVRHWIEVLDAALDQAAPQGSAQPGPRES